MTLVWLRSTDSIGIDVPAVREWTLPATGQAGLASFTIPTSSPAADPDYLAADGGTFVTIAGEDGCGDWSGIVTALEWREEGVNVEAMQSWGMLSHVATPVNRVLRNVNAGFVAYTVLRNALQTLSSAPLAAGGIAETPPFINEYVLDGASVWDVLNDLASLSGAELRVRTSSASGEGGASEVRDAVDVLEWGASAGTRYDTLLVAPGTFANASYTVDITESVSSVTVAGNGMRYTATDGTAAGLAHWPASLALNEDAPSFAVLKARADAELAMRRNPAITISGDVPRAHWALREGDGVAVVLPWARFTGVTARCRVVSRQAGHDPEYMRVTLVYVNETVAMPVTTNRVRGVGDSQGRLYRAVREAQRAARRAASTR